MSAEIIFEYSVSTNSKIVGLDPEVTFTIFVNVFILSPGLILSGE